MPVTDATVGAPVLAVRELTVAVRRRGSVATVLDAVSLDLDPGETVALVGESGAGKTVLALAIMGLLPAAMEVTSGSIRLCGDDLVGVPGAALRNKRGDEMAMVFQDPLSSLHPSFRVGAQIAEAIRAHRPGVDRRAANARAVELLVRVGIPDAAGRARAFPHQLSGGMRQRVMIAMAIANDPRLLVADEATTALDVTVQAQVLEVLRSVQQGTGAAMLVVTHDLGVVSAVADRVVVLYAGRVVETGAVDVVLTRPRHPYTQGLLAAVPRLDGDGAAVAPIPGQPPTPFTRAAGCAFHPRCRHAQEACLRDVPELVPVDVGQPHAVACARASELG